MLNVAKFVTYLLMMALVGAVALFLIDPPIVRTDNGPVPVHILDLLWMSGQAPDPAGRTEAIEQIIASLGIRSDIVHRFAGIVLVMFFGVVYVFLYPSTASVWKRLIVDETHPRKMRAFALTIFAFSLAINSFSYQTMIDRRGLYDIAGIKTPPVSERFRPLLDNPKQGF